MKDPRRENNAWIDGATHLLFQMSHWQHRIQIQAASIQARYQYCTKKLNSKCVWFMRKSAHTFYLCQQHVKRFIIHKAHHIFRKGQVTLNQNAHNLQHHFGAQFFMLFHMVCFVLWEVLRQETTFPLVKVLQQPIRNFRFKVFRDNTRSKMDQTMWKSIKN